MPTTAPGRLGIFSDAELDAARKRGHVDFLQRLGIQSATNGQFKDIYDKVLRRRVADHFAAVTDAEFDEAWRKGHIAFLGHAWGAQPDYFRRLRTQPYRAGPGWQHARTSRTEFIGSNLPVPDLKAIAFHTSDPSSPADKIRALNALNALLSPPEQLGGVFLPPGSAPRFDFMMVGEMPSMNEPSSGATSTNFNYDANEHDRFFQRALVKCGLEGVYVTDIVKQRAPPGRPMGEAIRAWLPVLLWEIDMIRPQGIIVLGKINYDSNFVGYVIGKLPRNIVCDWIYSYRRRSRHEFEQRLAAVMAKMRNAAHR